MNELVIPPAPHWYKTQVIACAPDNTLVYGSKNDVVVIREKGPQEPAEVRIIHGAHSNYVVSVSLNKKWKDPHSHVVSLGEDSILKLWDLETFGKKSSNKVHTEHKEPVIGAVFAGDDRVVSAAANGFVVIWNVNSNETKPLQNLFNAKVVLTCLSSCPHVGWLLAFGLNNGGVVVADLRRNGHVLYKLRGHYQSVVGLSWCPAPVNVFPRHVQNKVKNKCAETPICDESDKNESKKNKPNLWVNLVHADDGEIATEKYDQLPREVNDFLKECDDVKKKILGLETSVSEDAREKENNVKEADVELHYEEKGIEESESREKKEKLEYQRPFPTIFDPSGDFLDDSVEEVLEDKDVGTEKGAADSVSTPAKLEEPATNATDFEKNVASDDSVRSEEANATDIQKIVAAAKSEEGASAAEVVEEEPRTEYLLASSGRDGSIYIWRAGTDGRMQTFFNSHKRSSRRDAKSSNQWTSLCWIAPNTLLTSSAAGEVLLWPFPRPQESNKQHKIAYYNHSSLIFNLATPPISWTQYNWRDERNLVVWSWGKDGQLVNYDFGTNQIRSAYCAVSAQVTCLDSAAIDPNRVALGLKDGTILIWNLSLPHKNVVSIQKHHQKSTHKISAVAWHPSKEMLLGFGTEEGRVGYIDLVSKKNVLFPHYFHNQVYKVQWGPIKGDIANLGLYVLAEGKLVIYDVHQQKNEPLKVTIPDNCYVYRFAWKATFKCLLLNGKDGSLAILTTDLKTLTKLYLHEKGFNEIIWHPESIVDTSETSRCNWFAAATSKGLSIYDCGGLEECKIVASFEGHLRPPLALAWCPFDGNRIVSTAADGLAHVWDVGTKSLISTFADDYLSHNTGVVWSPADPDLIITGDKVIRVWSVSSNPPKTDEEFLSKRKQLLAKTDDEKSRSRAEAPKNKSISKNLIIPPIYSSSDENAAFQIAGMKKLLEGNLGDEPLDPLHLFGAKSQVAQLLTENYTNQKKEGKHKSCELISLWKGNIGDHIKDAINENRVTPSLINLAPMVSHTLWRDACIVYAKKLSEEAKSDPLETASYFLAAHQVLEAINCLCDGCMFKEALALAKHRLPDNSDIITTVTEKWANHCINAGNFETAALCYISIGRNEDAAKLLARRNNTEMLEFAAELAQNEENNTLYDSIKSKLGALKGEKENGVVKNMPSIIEVILSETVENVLKEIREEDKSSDTAQATEEALPSDDIGDIIDKGSEEISQEGKAAKAGDANDVISSSQ